DPTSKFVKSETAMAGGFAFLVLVLTLSGAFVSPRPPLPRKRTVHRAASPDPQFAANVGEATDTLRRDHGMIPRLAPGLNVADPEVSLEIAQVSALRFMGLTKYREFWDNFRQGVELISTSSRSEVSNVVQSGLYLRVRWRLIMAPKDVFSGQAQGAVQAAKGALSNFGRQAPDLFQAGSSFLQQAEAWAEEASSAPALERTVEFNSIYELDCWSGRIVKHTLEFRSPEENFDLLGTLQGMPSVR
ncbi:unnamed protein product, partial [Effrenium voratum]